MSNPQDQHSSPKHARAKPIGEVGEDFIEWLCSTPFGHDFVFRGPKYLRGGKEKELCDLLVLLDDTAIVMQVKTADRSNRAEWTEADWAKWANKKLREAVEQVEGACNALVKGLITEVSNLRQGNVPIQAPQIRHLYGVAVVDHPPMAYWGKSPVVTVNGRDVHILTSTHTEFQQVVTELSTAADFIDYLRARESFFAHNALVGSSELDLLAAYKGEPEEFVSAAEAGSTLMLDKGLWEAFAANDARKRREKLDASSYLVDTIIDHLHEDTLATLPHIEERRRARGQAGAPSGYIQIANRLARIRRIDRRHIGDKLMEKSRKCLEQKRDRWFVSMPETGPSVPIVFMVSIDTRANRLRWLETLVVAAKCHLNVQTIIGLTTEPVDGGLGFSVDGVMFEWSREDNALLPAEIRDLGKKLFGAPRRATLTEFGELDDRPQP